jgi:serpin B
LGWLTFAISGRGVAAPPPDLPTSSPPKQVEARDLEEVVQGSNRFGFELYQRLRSGNGNLFFSPAGISMALGMTYSGAVGETQAAMAKTLHFSSKQAVNAEMNALGNRWQTADEKQGFHLRVANRLWAQKQYTFVPEYLDLIRTNYRAEPARLDFAHQAELARQAINHWVDERTEHGIVNLIPSDEGLKDARLVLTNAVYFKGNWSKRFEKTLTKEADFHVSPDHAVKVRLMNRQDRFRYVAVDGMQLLQLPYGDGSLSMVVLLPHGKTSLAELEAKLTAKNLDKWLEAARPRTVNLFLPRFKSTAEIRLHETLAAMGMAVAFDASSADFSAMTGRPELCLSDLIHQGVVNVDEEGTKAAAASAVLAGARSAVTTPPEFRADHPFVCLIQDSRNGMILFLGRVIDPTH